MNHGKKPCKHHQHGEHNEIGMSVADKSGCEQKEDGLWCPQEDGTWIRDDGEVWEPPEHDRKGPHHRMLRMCRLQLAGWILGALLLLAGLVWGFFERKRRRLNDSHPQRQGSYVSNLCECFRRPSLCLPACLFTPVLAALN